MKENSYGSNQRASGAIYRNDCELYKKIINLNPNAMFLSCDNKFVFANKKALEMIKAGNLEVLQTLNTIDIVHPRYRNEVAGRKAAKISELFALDTLEVKLLCMDKSVIDVEMESIVFVFGDMLYNLTTIKEIGKWKEIQRVYQERDVLINAIVDSTIDGILVIDEDSKVINVNNRLIDMWGLDEVSFWEKDEISILKHILSNVEEDKLLEDIFNKAGSIVNEYFDNVSFKDGRVFNFYSCPLIIEGEITGRIWSFRDITKQAEAEEKLYKSNCELAEIIEKLKETQAQLIQKEKLAGIGQLAAGVAHEINNPLAYTISNMDMLSKRLDTSNNIIKKYMWLAENIGSLSYQDIKLQIDTIKELEEKSKFIHILEDMDELIDDSLEGLHKARKIVASLRDFSNENGADRHEEYNLNEGIENTLTIMGSEIKHKVEIVKDLKSVPRIKANGGQINQVILSMLHNAVHAIKLKGESGQGQIILKTYGQDEHIVCEIEDNGIGIAKENISKIFLPFYTTKDVGEGCGLGLSTAYDIITNKHRGEIIVTSVYGQGTKFIILLPA